MANLPWLLLAIVAAYGCAGVAALLRGRMGAVASWGFVPIVLACPLIVPAERIGLRAAAAFVVGDLGFRMADFFRQWDGIEKSRVLREYLRFLFPFPVLAAAYPDGKRRLARPANPWREAGRILGGVAGFGLALLALGALSRLEAVRSSFALNHVVMLPTFVLAIESLSRALWGLERLAGFDTRPFVRNAYQSRTVAEFWQRYNNRIHEWLYRNVFLRVGGRRAPVRSVLLVFLVSGVFHEAMFAIATSRLTGYQFAFFVIQAPAVLVSGRLERLARRAGLVGEMATRGVAILFLGVTSVLFFEGVDRVFPFVYVSESPLP